MKIDYTLISSIRVVGEDAYLTPSFTIRNDEGDVAYAVLEAGEEIAMAFVDGDAMKLQERMTELKLQHNTFLHKLLAVEEERNTAKDVFTMEKANARISYYRAAMDAIMKERAALMVALQYIDTLRGPGEDVE